MWASNSPATSCACAFLCPRCWLRHSQSHSCFNQLTNRSVWFNSRSYASLPGETTSVFSHFKSPCRSEKPKASSWVMNLKKKRTPIFPEEYDTQVSVHCTISIECQACEVQRLLLQFLAECTMLNNTST